MIRDLKPYPSYKESSVEWLGEVPEHWEVLPGRACYLEKKVANKGLKEAAVLSLSYGQIVVKPEEKLHGLVPESFETYQIVEPGDIIIRSTDLQNDKSSLRFGLSRHSGIITSAYMCFNTQVVMNKEYGHLLLHTYDMKKVFYGLGSGLRQNLDWRDFKYLPCLVPPLHDQVTIVRFLDYMDQRIQRHIRAKQKLIGLLNEQKQVTIDHAVTRGLDPNVRLKPSGVGWLGEIPEHWEVLPLKRRWAVIDCKHLTVPFVEDGVPLASVREVQSFDLSLSKAKRTSIDWYETLIAGGRKPRRGDLIYCRNVSVGASAFVGTDDRFAMGQDVCFIRSVDQNQRYLNYYLHSPLMSRQLAMLLVGSTFNRINVEDIKGLIIVLPTRYEQDSLCGYLDEAHILIERPIHAANREIDLIREYRTRLIADVVTGKLDVRAEAAQLPDEVDEQELIEDLDVLGKEEAEDTDFDGTEEDG